MEPSAQVGDDDWRPLASASIIPPESMPRRDRFVRACLIGAAGLTALWIGGALVLPAITGGFVVLLLRRARPQLDVANAGIRIVTNWGHSRTIPWPFIAWNVSETTDDGHRIVVGTADGRVLEAQFPRESYCRPAFEQLDRQICALQFEASRKKWERGERLDFGCIALRPSGLRITTGIVWKDYPLSVWRSPDQRVPSRTIKVPGLVRNPRLLVALLQSIHAETAAEWSDSGELRFLTLPGA